MASPTVKGQNDVKYVRLGKSGLKISVPVVGCMSYGSDQWMVSHQSFRARAWNRQHLFDRIGFSTKTRYEIYELSGKVVRTDDRST